MPTVSTLAQLDRAGRCAVAVRDGSISVADLGGRAWWTLPGRHEVALVAPDPTCDQIFGESTHDEIIWDVLVPYGADELRKWIDARTNARASRSQGVRGSPLCRPRTGA